MNILRKSVTIILGFVCTVLSQSPCPDVFEYKGDGIGEITVRPSGSVTSVTIRVNYTVTTRLASNNVGRLEPIGNTLQLIEEFNKGTPILYRVYFPFTSPVPKITSITVNGNSICYGSPDYPRLNQYVSTVTLQHMMYLKSSPGTFIQYNPDDKPNIIYDTSGNNDYEGPNIPSPPIRWPRPRPRPIPDTTPSRNEFVNIPSRDGDDFTDPSECGVVGAGNLQLPLIYNGQSYNRGDWPWLVAIYKRKDGALNFICSGTLISNRHVVTAAHCMKQKNTLTSIKDIVLKVGVFDLEQWGDDITIITAVVNAAIHESFNTSTLANDILLFTMEKTVKFNFNIRPACLWSGNTDLNRIVGAAGVVAGWGRSELGAGGHGEPRMVRIPVVSTDTCRASKPEFHKLTSDKTLCAGDRIAGAGPCLGDSGGGLYILDDGRWRIRGIVSLSLRPETGDNTCNLKQFIIFTDAAKYIPWIRNAMNS